MPQALPYALQTRLTGLQRAYVTHVADASDLTLSGAVRAIVDDALSADAEWLDAYAHAEAQHETEALLLDALERAGDLPPENLANLQRALDAVRAGESPERLRDAEQAERVAQLQRDAEQQGESAE